MLNNAGSRILCNSAQKIHSLRKLFSTYCELQYDQVQRQITIRTAIVLSSAGKSLRQAAVESTVEKPSEAQGHGTDTVGLELEEIGVKS